MVLFFALCAAVVVVGRSFAAPDGSGWWRRRHALRACGLLLVCVAFAAAPGGLVLSKSVARMLLPLGLLWLTLVAATLVRLVQRRHGAAGLTGLLLVVITLLGSEPLGQQVMERLERPYQRDPFAEDAFDAVVVLGGGAQEAPHAHHELGPSGDRIFLGARLWHAGKTPLLVTTGTPIEGFQRPFDSLSATTTMWQEVGVPAAAIVQVPGTRTTSEEAEAVAKVAGARGWQRIGLVTSAWHLRRAERLFARRGVSVVPLAADHRGAPTWEGIYSLIPVGNGAYLQQKAAWEWLGAAVGR